MTTPSESTVISTSDAQGLVSSTPMVNTAQTPAAPVQQQQPTPSYVTSTGVDVSAMQVQYEGRIRNLMSEKDRALNERDKVIGQMAELQKEYADYKTMNSTSLNSAVEAGQKITTENKTLQAEVIRLKGELTRARVLLEKPHLAAYQRFIPVTDNEQELQESVKQLEEIRSADMQRNGYLPTAPLQSPSQQQQPATTQQGIDPLQQLAALYQGRSNLPQSLVQAQGAMPGSTPGMINPSADLNPTTRIQQLFDDAKRSSDPLAFQKAVEQAKVLANAATQQQLGVR